MRRRPWLVLLAIWTWLVAMTLLGALFINTRLDDADAVLEVAADPILEAVPVDELDLDAITFCDPSVEERMPDVLREFDEAIAVEQENSDEPIVRARTRTTLSSFMLHEASTQVSAGLNRVEIHSDRVGNDWCVSKLEHTTEEARGEAK